MIRPASTARMLRRPLPFAGGGARHGVGARNVPPAEWLETTGEDVKGQLEEKARLFDTRRSAVLAALPGTDAASAELLELVRADAAGSCGLPAKRVPEGCHPLEEAGRLVPEDFCLQLPDPASGELTLVAASVCFPNRWRLADKIGRTVTAVHTPVPGYAREIGGPVQRLMERLPSGRVMERSNWGLADGADLFAPGERAAYPKEVQEIPDRLWLRIERQTLRTLPRSGAVVFTIRTLQAPVGILRSDREAAELLAKAIRELPADVADYKLGSVAVREVILRWLLRA